MQHPSINKQRSNQYIIADIERIYWCPNPLHRALMLWFRGSPKRKRSPIFIPTLLRATQKKGIFTEENSMIWRWDWDILLFGLSSPYFTSPGAHFVPFSQAYWQSATLLDRGLPQKWHWPIKQWFWKKVNLIPQIKN